MTTTDAGPDALLDRLAALRRDLLDDAAAARTLALAEAALVPTRSQPPARWRRLCIPAALAAWAVIYLWGAVGQLGRVFTPQAAHDREVATVALATPTGTERQNH